MSDIGQVLGPLRASVSPHIKEGTVAAGLARVLPVLHILGVYEMTKPQ